jgi:hypothetical protein
VNQVNPAFFPDLKRDTEDEIDNVVVSAIGPFSLDTHGLSGLLVVICRKGADCTANATHVPNKFFTFNARQCADVDFLEFILHSKYIRRLKFAQV